MSIVACSGVMVENMMVENSISLLVYRTLRGVSVYCVYMFQAGRQIIDLYSLVSIPCGVTGQTAAVV